MKVYIICYIPVQITYLEKFDLRDIGQNNFGQSDCKF